MLTDCPAAVGNSVPYAGGTPAGKPVVEVGRVVRVVDGDTYDVLTGGHMLRVRLIGADAPELGQPFGRQVADSVAQLLRPQRLVRLTRHGQDLYGRTLATVTLPPLAGKPGTGALDSLLVARGWAWARAPRHKEPRLAAVQQLAQRQERGLWRCSPAVRPTGLRYGAASAQLVSSAMVRAVPVSQAPLISSFSSTLSLLLFFFTHGTTNRYYRHSGHRWRARVCQGRQHPAEAGVQQSIL